jgi:hypothetical protein
VRARLINPQQLTISPISRAAIQADPLTDEPLGAIPRGTAVQLLGQLEEVRNNVRAPGRGGAQIPAIYTLTFRRVDLVRLAYWPLDGDRVTSVADRRGNNPRSLNVYVQAATQDGLEHTGPKLITVELVTRPPSREVVEGVS